MDHPYRIIANSASGGYAVISLVKVYPADAMPTRIRHPCVEALLHRVRITAPHGFIAGVCMPPRPEGMPNTRYERELIRAYELLDKLALAPAS